MQACLHYNYWYYYDCKEESQCILKHKITIAKKNQSWKISTSRRKNNHLSVILFQADILSMILYSGIFSDNIYLWCARVGVRTCALSYSMSPNFKKLLNFNSTLSTSKLYRYLTEQRVIILIFMMWVSVRARALKDVTDVGLQLEGRGELGIELTGQVCNHYRIARNFNFRGFRGSQKFFFNCDSPRENVV